MTTADVCSIEGCNEPSKSRGWCQPHYMRWWYSGDTDPATPLVKRAKGRACSVEGCSRKHRGHGFCEGHLRRYKSTGDPGPAEFEPRRAKGNACDLDGCDRPRYAKGVCELHHRRMRDFGSYYEVLLLAQWVGDEATYNAVHLRLRAQRGAAKDSTCPCGAAAEHWAYVRGDDQSVRYDERGRPYSIDLSRYVALCRTCHRRMDAEATRTRGCSVDGCEGEHKSRGMCSKHYQAARK